MATVYTRDPAVMRRLDALVIDFPEVYRCIGATDMDKTYEMPKSSVSLRITEHRITQFTQKDLLIHT